MGDQDHAADHVGRAFDLCAHAHALSRLCLRGAVARNSDLFRISRTFRSAFKSRDRGDTLRNTAEGHESVTLALRLRGLYGGSRQHALSQALRHVFR